MNILGELLDVRTQALLPFLDNLGTPARTGAGLIPAFHSVLCARVFAVVLFAGYSPFRWAAQFGLDGALGIFLNSAAIDI